MCFEIFFAECQKKKHSAKAALPSARKQHSVNHLALGKEPVSGSVLLSSLDAADVASQT